MTDSTTHPHDQRAPAPTADGAGRYHGHVGSTRLAKLCILFVVFHLGMTALYLGPTPGPIRSLATRYMEPVFKQSWWVFAPDPVSSNKYLLVRAKKADGSVTPWFNITQCDISAAIHHHPVPNRRYLASFQMMRHYEIGRDNLPQKAQELLHEDRMGSGWNTTLRTDLQAAGATAHQADDFAKNDRVVNNLASLVAQSRWGADLEEIQVQMEVVHTRPFAERNTSAPLKTDIWQQGYLPFTPGDAPENTKVDELYGTKAGC